MGNIVRKKGKVNNEIVDTIVEYSTDGLLEKNCLISDKRDIGNFQTRFFVVEKSSDGQLYRSHRVTIERYAIEVNDEN